MRRTLVAGLAAVLATAATVAAVTTGTTLAGSPAAAVTVAVEDPVGDAPDGVDATTVRYRNNSFRIMVGIDVADLHREGQATLLVSAPGSAVGYEATVWIKPDRTLGAKLTFVDGDLREDQDCEILGHWDSRRDHISIRVPQRCHPRSGFLSPADMTASTGRGSDRDTVDTTVVARGVSPGCVTESEFRYPDRHTSRAEVSAWWDTQGQSLTRTSTTDRRRYSICGVPDHHVYAKYTRDSDGRWFLTWKRVYAAWP